MEPLFEKHFRRLDGIPIDFTRGLMEEINWNARLIGIKGARGVGKTTLLLQYIKNNLPLDKSTLYVSLDGIWFNENKLTQLADDFVKQGGRYLFLDEVHKYPNWSQELKNIYDEYPDLKLVFTGSSLLELLNARADLSRRAVVYSMQGLSYREYLNLSLNLNLPKLNLEDILKSHEKLSRDILKQVKPLKHFTAYLKNGYYPFFYENQKDYYRKLEEVLNLVLEIELPLLRQVDVTYVPRVKQLLQIISESVPFVPNVSKLSERIGVNRNTFITYLYYLQEAHITRNLYRDSKGITRLQKPDKIYLENSNIQYALSPEAANKGNVRESFFVNQLAYQHRVEYLESSDFLVDGKCVFEIGGKGKTPKQIRKTRDAYLVLDDIEYGVGKSIPLWLFGFLY